MTFDLSIIFDIPECQYFAALRCHVAFAFKIRNHRALRCFLYLSYFAAGTWFYDGIVTVSWAVVNVHISVLRGGVSPRGPCPPSPNIT